MTCESERYKLILTSSGERQIVPALIDIEPSRILAMFDSVLDGLEAALYARRIELPRKRSKAWMDSGPDHRLALTAARRFMKMMSAGRARPRPEFPHTEEEKAYYEDVEIAAAAEQANAAADIEQARAAVELKFRRPWKAKPPETLPPPTFPSLIAARHERMRVLFERALQVQEEASRARQTVQAWASRREFKAAIDLGPDHGTAVAAAELLFEILTAGRATPKPPKKVEVEESIEETLARVTRILVRNGFIL
jgi:hypothetical protein